MLLKNISFTFKHPKSVRVCFTFIFFLTLLTLLTQTILVAQISLFFLFQEWTGSRRQSHECCPVRKEKTRRFPLEKPPEVFWEFERQKSHNLIACVFLALFFQRFLYEIRFILRVLLRQLLILWVGCHFPAARVVVFKDSCFFSWKNPTVPLHPECFFTPLKSNIRNTNNEGLVQMIFLWKWVIFRFHVWFAGSVTNQYNMGLYGTSPWYNHHVGEYSWELFASASIFVGKSPSFRVFHLNLGPSWYENSITPLPWVFVLVNSVTPHHVLYGGGNSKILLFSAQSLGKIPMLTSIFFKGVETTN